jgi:FAD/FMN-containing dehydrogenase
VRRAVRLADILAVVCRPEPSGGGWFLPVSPGTRFVTLGGAIANDVHGKNHHRAGTFGRHLREIELARSDGTRLVCSERENGALFAATIGGLGLTGVILRATLQLRRAGRAGGRGEDIRFGALDEFFALAEDSDHDWEYTAAWVDCLARGAALGRGILFAGAPCRRYRRAAARCRAAPLGARRTAHRPE